MPCQNEQKRNDPAAMAAAYAVLGRGFWALQAWKEKADRAQALASRLPPAKPQELPQVACGGSYL